MQRIAACTENDEMKSISLAFGIAIDVCSRVGTMCEEPFILWFCAKNATKWNAFVLAVACVCCGLDAEWETNTRFICFWRTLFVSIYFKSFASMSAFKI